MKNNTRSLESLAPIIHYKKGELNSYPFKILISPSDIGVIKNFGKNGSRFAPIAIINQLKKFNHHLKLKDKEAILVEAVTSLSAEKENLEKAQIKSALNITKLITDNDNKKIIHLGGGHDHVLPLLMAVDNCNQFSNLLIINIDAHCDTRIDENHHSGTPFRNFDRNGKSDFHLIQLGIHEYANSKSTLQPISRGSEEKIYYSDSFRGVDSFNELIRNSLKACPFKINDKTAVILSIDCDGISGNEMPAVSAPNTLGVSLEQIFQLLNTTQELNSNTKFLGLYEYNPLFDSINTYAAKSIAHIIESFLKK